MEDTRILMAAAKLLDSQDYIISDPVDNWYAIYDEEADEYMLIKVVWDTDRFPSPDIYRDEYEARLADFIGTGFFEKTSGDISEIYAGCLGFWVVSKDRAITRLAKYVEIKDRD